MFFLFIVKEFRFPPSMLNESEGSSSMLKPLEVHSGSGRRAFLVGLGATFASVAFGSSKSYAWGSSKQTPIPAAWVRRFGNDVVSYGRYLDRLNLKYISTTQIIAPHLKKRGSVHNTLPPKRQWKNMRTTLKVADLMSKYLKGGPKDIVSAYRSPRYNSACRGAKRKSMHLQNNALDIVFRNSPYTVSRVARGLRDRGAFKGGVGRYNSFTHVDTRGYNADW